MYGQLGDGSTLVRTSPVPVTGGHKFRSIACGEWHTCGLLADGTALCWVRVMLPVVHSHMRKDIAALSMNEVRIANTAGLFFAIAPCSLHLAAG